MSVRRFRDRRHALRMVARLTLDGVDAQLCEWAHGWLVVCEVVA